MAQSVKAFLSGPGSAFSGLNGEKFQNKNQVAEFCAKIWNGVEFQKSESQGCDWIVHPKTPPASRSSKSRKSNTFSISFDHFQNYLKEQAARGTGGTNLLRRPGGWNSVQESEAEMASGGDKELEDRIAQKEREVAQLQLNWNQDNSPANWSRLQQAKSELANLKAQRGQHGQPQRPPQPYYPANTPSYPVGNPNPPMYYNPSVSAEGESSAPRRSSRRLASGAGGASTTETEQEQARRGRSKSKGRKKKSKSKSRSRGRKKKSHYSTAMENETDGGGERRRRRKNEDEEEEEYEAEMKNENEQEMEPKKRKSRSRSKGKRTRYSSTEADDAIMTVLNEAEAPRGKRKSSSKGKKKKKSSSKGRKGKKGSKKGGRRKSRSGSRK